MDKENIEKPFQAYDGDEKYIFVSYAHLDRKVVFSEIERFHDEGYPIWYDDGLVAGQEWDEEIARALVGSSLLVVFISKNSMASPNVRDEIKMALNRKIDITPIYLENTELPLSLELRLSNKHAIYKHSLTNNDYIRDCFKAFKKAGIPKLDFDDISESGDNDFNLNIPDFNENEPYIFTCYAHRDHPIVFPEIERFRSDGYNVLYDDMFEMGSQWYDSINKSIKNCSLFVFFVTENSLLSSNTTQEVHLALENNIPVVPIYLENVQIENQDLRFRLSIVPSIFKYDLSDEDYVRIYTMFFRQHYVL